MAEIHNWKNLAAELCNDFLANLVSSNKPYTNCWQIFRNAHQKNHSDFSNIP